MEMHSSSESFTSLEDAFQYIENFANLERSPQLSGHEYKLERMRVMLEFFNHPEKAFRSVHIAGSKGKGSTTAICAAILEKHGLKTGMFTSPHLISYTERISLNGRPFPEEVYIRETNRIRNALENGNLTAGLGAPTTFELLTLLAFLIFREEKCSWAVIETGLGGRLDCTNLIIPEVSIITSIELEHCDILGDTYEQIAFEKSGIIKENIPVIIQKQRPEVMAVLEREAALKNSPLFCSGEKCLTEGAVTGKNGTVFRACFPGLEPTELKTNLTGTFQCANIVSAISALSGILEDFDMDKTKKALTEVNLEGRMEITGSEPPIIIDGSHTENSVKKLLDSCIGIFGNEGILMFGSVKGKNYRKMVDILFSHFSQIIISAPVGYKETDTEKIYRYAVNKFPEKEIYYIEECAEGLKKALELSGKQIPVIVTGSFYLAGAVKKLLQERMG